VPGGATDPPRWSARSAAERDNTKGDRGRVSDGGAGAKAAAFEQECVFPLSAQHVGRRHICSWVLAYMANVACRHFSSSCEPFFIPDRWACCAVLPNGVSLPLLPPVPSPGTAP
jgi:hypothetical protein